MDRTTVVLEQFRDGGAEPPRDVVQALTVLIGDAMVSHAVAVYDFGKPTMGSVETVASWECTGIAGDVLVRVSASRPGGEWFLDDFDSGSAAPTVYGELVPLGEVAGCRLLSLQSYGDAECLTRWQVQLRNGDSFQIPWPKDRLAQTRHEALALEVATRIR
ncbi:hypothetical protein ACGFIF_43690 [Kribbella sp. NPDC049174]|uniref:hypothetical protein n=1 Tax=Kribbella sp. NPDC049174 TaxID=3364112 RepID=UPI0037220DE8